MPDELKTWTTSLPMVLTVPPVAKAGRLLFTVRVPEEVKVQTV